MEAVGNGSEGDVQDRSNGAGPGSDLKGGGLVGSRVRQQEMVGDGGDAQVPGEVPPPSGTTDHGADGKTWGRWIVGVPPGSGGNGICWYPPPRGLH